MIGKLIIAGAVIVVAVLFLVPGISNIVPNFPSLEAITERVTNTNNSTDSDVMTQQDDIQSHNEITQQDDMQQLSLDQIDPKYVNKETYVGQVFEKSDGKCKISVPDLAETINSKKEITHILEVDNCVHDVNEPVQVTKIETKDDVTIPVISTNSITVNSYPKTVYYDVIQLTSTHKGNDVLINYNDASGNTIGVVVTLRNSDKEIFSGQFTSSKFETIISDVPNTPHMIEMTVEHAVYRTLHASVYAPADSQDSTISGIFTES